MAELQINKRYVNEAELGGDLFRQTSFYSDKALQTAFDSGMSFDLGKIAFENRNRDLSSIGISMNDYNYLSGLGQMTALETAFVLDPNETAKTEKGKEYNVRDANIEFLKAEIQQGKNQEIYQNTSDFSKFWMTIGSGIANFGVEFYGAFEGVLDAGATIINLLANDDTITEWIAKDKTGYKAAKEALNDFNSKYTFIGHTWLGTAWNDINTISGNLAWVIVPGLGGGVAATRAGLTLGAKALTKGVAKAGVKAANIASRIGRTVYWGSMAGHASQTAAEYSLKNDANPISGAGLFGYTAAVTGIEFLTEMMGSKLVGGSAIDRLVLGKLTSSATKIGTKLSTKSAIGATLYRTFGDVFSEGVEEIAAEWAEGLLWANAITGNPEDRSSFGDIMYAGLLGGIMGGVMSGARLGMTKSVSVTRDGQVIQTSLLTDEQKKNAVQLNKAQTILLSDSLGQLNKRLSTEKDYMAQAREGYITQENAQALTEQQNKKLIQSTAGLSQFFANIGDEEFKKSFDLLNGSIEQQAQSIRNFANKQNIETKLHKELVERWNELHPHQSIDIVDDPTIEAKQIQKYVQEKFGVNVLIMKTGAQDGVNDVVDGITLDENTIGFREDALKTRGARGVLQDVIAHELAHTLTMTGGIITPKNLLQVKRVIDDSGIKTKSVYKSSKIDLTELSEAQADAIAEALLFDDRVVEKILYNEQNIFKKVFNWMRNLAIQIKTKEKNTPKNFELYKTLVKRMATYRAIVAANVGNKEDADLFVKQLSLTDIEIKELMDTYLPTWRTENCSITKYNVNTEALQKMDAVNLLAANRKSTTDEMFDFSRAFDPEYYSADFVASVTEAVPNSPFKEAIQSVVFIQTGYIISNDGWVIDGRNIINDLNENFVNDLISGAMLTPEKQVNYPTLNQLLNNETQKLFIGADGSTAENVKVVFKNSVDDKTFDADYNYVTKELSITIPSGDIKAKIKRYGFESQLQRCMAMAIADVHSFYGGLVPLVVQQSLNKMTPVNFDKLSKHILTDEFLALEHTKQDLVDMMTYKITELTTTQRSLDDVTSGFITDGIDVQGYGDFFGINFKVAGAPSETDVKNLFNKIKTQNLTAAYKKATPVDKVERQLTFDVSETPEKVVPVKKSEKPKKAIDNKPLEKTETAKEGLKAPNERAKNLTNKIKNFEFSSKHLSETQKMDKLTTDDKLFDKAVREEFVGEFGEDLPKMRDDDLLYYIEYYKENKYKMSVSAIKTFQFIFEYAHRFDYQFKKSTVTKLQEFLTLEFNLNASALSTFGHIINEAMPIHTIERQAMQEGLEFTIPDAMKTRWVNAVKTGDIITQTEIEERVKEKGREAFRKAPRKWNFLEKGITKDERQRRLKNDIDRINGFRYLAMLSNPATHIRNIVSNAGIKTLSRTAEAFERLFDKLIDFDENDLKYLPEQKVTKEDLDFVEKRYGKLLDAVAKIGKYDTRTGTDTSHMLDNIRREEMFNNKILKFMQTLIYDKSLNKMDAKFSRPELTRVLAQLLVANFPKQLEFEKQNYDKIMGDLLTTVRKFEDIREAYDVAYEETTNKLIAQRNLDDANGKKDDVAKINKQLGIMSDLYKYIDERINDKIDINDVDFLQQFVKAKDLNSAKKLFNDYLKTKKDVEITSLVKTRKQVKTARDLLEKDGINDTDLTTLFDVATRKVLTNYLRYENRAFKAWCKIMDASMVMRALGSVVIPFAKVVTNMTILIYKYSPVTFLRGLKNLLTYGKGKNPLPEIKNTYGNSWRNLVNYLWYGTDDARFLKAQSAEDLATGTVGTLLMLFGVLLAELGVVEKDDDDEKYGGYLLHLFGTDIQLKLSDIAPGATPFISGAAIAAGAKDDGIGGALSQWWEQITNDTLYGSFNDLFEGYGEGIIGKASDIAQTYFTQFVPAILRSIQKFTNDKAAVNYKGNWFNTTFERILSALPGISGLTLPSKVDEYTGEPVKAYNSGIAALLNIFSPVTISKDKTDTVRKLAQEVGATTTGASGKIIINDTEYNLQGNEKQQFQSDRAKYINTLITDFTKNKTKVRVQQEDGTYKELTYSQMTDAEKQTAFKSYYSKATNYAKIDYWVRSGHKYVTSSRDEYNTLRKLGINATYMNNVKGSKFKN